MAERHYEDLTREELIRLLEARDRRDATRFGLVWEANEIERDKALNSDFVALDLVPELCVGKTPWQNLVIEGDNFDALRALRLAYSGRVRLIYIDPPYNTGQNDFVYNDRFVDKNDLWRHSKWIEFMHQRLVLARDLLTPDGAIFVSIDDNEVHTLGLLMKRIFGETNFVANIIWQKRTSPDARIDLGPAHDYIVVFAQQKDVLSLKKLTHTAKQLKSYKNPDNDPRGPWVSSDYSAQGHRPNQMYTITTPTGVRHKPPAGMCWKNVEEVFLKLVADKRIWFGKDGNGVPRRKTFLSESEGISSWTWWPHGEVGHNQEAKKEIMEILGGSVPDEIFSTPKPVRLIERILQIGSGPEDLILDFFAGSGTTAHAVLKQNAADGGHRRFILVSNTEATEAEPDKNLCRDVCARRVRKAIEGYGETPGLGGDFAYLRARRLARGRLTKLSHEQVWTLLQLIHGETLAPFEEKRWQWAGDAERALLYLPSFRPADAAMLRKKAGESAAVILYSWQSELVRQHLSAEHVQFEHLPEALSRRFGLKG